MRLGWPDKRVVVITALCMVVALAATAFLLLRNRDVPQLAGPHLTWEEVVGEGGHYVVEVRCTNCGWEATAEVPKGRVVSDVVCPKCRAWKEGERVSGFDEGGSSTLVRAR